MDHVTPLQMEISNFRIINSIFFDFISLDRKTYGEFQKVLIIDNTQVASEYVTGRMKYDFFHEDFLLLIRNSMPKMIVLIISHCSHECFSLLFVQHV